MLDGWFRPRMDPVLNRAGVWLADQGATADRMTLAGLAFGLGAAAAVALGQPLVAAVLILLGRIADGLDGAIARAKGRRGEGSDLGGYHDILADFVFYGALPLGFALQGHGAAAAFLLFAFYVNGASFLGYAILAAKRGITTEVQGRKAFYYAAGLMEGAETIGFFLAMCLFPWAFSPLALVFGTLCLVTAAGRWAQARRVFAP